MHRLAFVLALAGSIACHDRSVTESGPTGGYARLSGHLTRSTGTPIGGVTLFVSCGPTTPSGFGHDLATTDAAGAYAADVDTPAGYPVPTDGRLMCQVVAPAGGPAHASTTSAVLFARDAAARTTTVVNLAEGSTTP
jgi:hypothetical protein